MNILLIAFDFHRMAGLATFRTLMERTFPGTWHALEGVYIVRTPATAKELRDVLKPTLAENDELLIVTLQPNGWTWRSNSDSGVDWLRTNA